MNYEIIFTYQFGSISAWSGFFNRLEILIYCVKLVPSFTGVEFNSYRFLSSIASSMVMQVSHLMKVHVHCIYMNRTRGT